MSDPTHNTGIYIKQGGNQLVVASGGSIKLETGGEIVDNAGASLMASGGLVVADVTATAAEINLLVGLTASKLIYGNMAVARTATADGTGTGTIAAAGWIQFVMVTSDNADKIIVLPTPTPGVMVILSPGSQGYELRTSDPSTVALQGVTGSGVESAIASGSMVMAFCISATEWRAFAIDDSGAIAGVALPD